MKRKILFMAVAIVIIIGLVVHFFVICPRKLNKNIDTKNISIYIPNGFANTFHDYMLFSFDDYRIWEYKLDKREISIICNELDNDIWKQPEKEEYDNIISVFIGLGGMDTKPARLSYNQHNIYYCVFDDSLHKFININSNTNAISGWHRELFIFDSSQNIYWCISRGI